MTELTELLLAIVVMLILFRLASAACGREMVRNEEEDKPHYKKAA